MEEKLRLTDEQSLGQIAYETYQKLLRARFVAIPGPGWEHLSGTEQQVWQEVAEVVKRSSGEKK